MSARTSRPDSSPTRSATIPALVRPIEVLTAGDDSPPAVAAALAFVLEGLHLSKRLNKDVSERRAIYRAR